MKRNVVFLLIFAILSVDGFSKCDICQILADQIQKFVDANKTLDQTTFHRQTDDLCRDLLQNEWLTVYCQYEMDMNALELYDIFVKRQDPKKVCEYFGYCDSKSERNTKPFSLNNKKEKKKEVPPIQSDDDYSFIVLSDTHIGQASRTEYISWLAEVAIKKINGMIKSEDIRMAFVTGDITDSALPEQWIASRKILDQLQIPYFPALGNHDVWSYNNSGSSKYEEEHPTGDQLFAKTFGDLFSHPKLNGSSIFYNNTPTHNVDENIISYFQNWQMNYRNFVFFGLDWNTRQHALPGWKGALPVARIHDYPGGTLPWLRERLKTVPSSSQVIFFQHHPFAMPPFIPGMVFSFSEYKQKQIFKAIEESNVNFWGVMAGHLHTWFNGEAGYKQSRQWLTEASKTASSISLVKVRGGKIVDISQLFGFDY